MKSLKSLLILGMLLLTSFLACDPNAGDPVDPGDPRDKFLGDWNVNETCNRGNYYVTIYADSGNSTQVLLHGFGNPGPNSDDAVGLVVSDKIIVASQTIGEGWTISGEGTYQSNGTITWTYTLVIGPSTLDCTAVFSN
jgi:hypothetical protein